MRYAPIFYGASAYAAAECRIYTEKRFSSRDRALAKPLDMSRVIADMRVEKSTVADARYRRAEQMLSSLRR